VTSRGRCHSCGERLTASPLPELESGPDDDEVGYRLEQWDSQTRGALIRTLIRAGVPHRFEEEELVILAVDEAEVDRLVERTTGSTALDPDEDEDEQSGPDLAMGDQSASKALYEAARRLREDPTDMQADVALAEASTAVFAVDYLPDLDEDQLAAVGRVTRRLLGALGADEALEDEIRHQAEVPCRLVAASAGDEPVDDEAERARARLEAGAKQKGRLVELPQSSVTPGGEMTAATLEGEPGGPGGPSGLASSGAQRDGAGTSLVGAGSEVDVDEEAENEEGFDEEPEDDEDSGELVYELAEWLPEQRVELSMLLESAGIPYNWDATDLTVAEEHETEVDGLFEQVHGLVDEDDEARYHSIEELFGSVDRLANDPANLERREAFLEAVGAVELPTPVGVDDAFWWRVRSQGHAVVAALDNKSRDDEISREASLLAEMLHEMV
jgi:hypothetical protein